MLSVAGRLALERGHSASHALRWRTIAILHYTLACRLSMRTEDWTIDLLNTSLPRKDAFLGELHRLSLARVGEWSIHE